MCALDGAADDSQRDSYMDDHMNNRKVSVNFVMHPQDGNMPKQNDLLRRVALMVQDDPYLSDNARLTRWNQQDSVDVMTKWNLKKSGVIIINRAVHTAGMIDVYDGHKVAEDVVKWIADNIQVDKQVIDIFELGKEYLEITDAAGARLSPLDKNKVAEIIERGKGMMQGLKERENSKEFRFHVNYDHLPIDGRFAEAFLKHLKKFARILDEKQIPVREQIRKELDRLEGLSKEAENMKESKRAKVIARFWTLQWLHIGKGQYNKIKEIKEKALAEEEDAKKAQEEKMAALLAEKEAEEKREAEEKAALQKAVDEADDLDSEWEGNIVEDHPAVPQLTDDDDHSADLADNDGEEAESAKELRDATLNATETGA